MKKKIEKGKNDLIMKLNNVKENKNSGSIKIRTQRYIGRREIKDIWYDILEWIGSLLLLSTYIFSLDKTCFNGFCFNTVGSFIFIVICYDRGKYRVFFVNLILFWGSIYEFMKYQLS